MLTFRSRTDKYMRQTFMKKAGNTVLFYRKNFIPLDLPVKVLIVDFSGPSLPFVIARSV